MDITGLPLELAIIDTLSRCAAGDDENSSKDMGRFVKNVEKLLQTLEAHVLLVHHTPVSDTGRPQGWGGVLAGVSTHMRMEESGAVRSLIVETPNNSEEGERVAFTLKSIELGVDATTGIVTTAPVVVPVESAPTRAEKPKQKLTPQLATALTALCSMCAEHGSHQACMPGAVVGVPMGGVEMGRPCCTEETFQTTSTATRIFTTSSSR